MPNYWLQQADCLRQQHRKQNDFFFASKNSINLFILYAGRRQEAEAGGRRQEAGGKSSRQEAALQYNILQYTSMNYINIYSQLLSIIILKFNSSALLNLSGNIFPYCPAVGAIRRTNFFNIDLPGWSMLDL